MSLFIFRIMPMEICQIDAVATVYIWNNVNVRRYVKLMMQLLFIFGIIWTLFLDGSVAVEWGMI